MNNITIELSKEDRRRFDDALYFLARICAQMENSGTPFDAPAEKQPEAPDAPAEEKAPEPEPTRTVKRDDVQKKVVDLAGDLAKKAQVREIVKAYANCVTDIPEDKLPEVWDKLTALEG